MGVTLTEPQRRCLTILRDYEDTRMDYLGRKLNAQQDGQPFRGVLAGEVAHAMWPDSPGWKRMSKGYNGFPGKVMPRAAGSLLHRLEDKGLVWHDWTDHHLALWYIKQAGRDALA